MKNLRIAIKTTTGYRVYGEMSCVMDINDMGEVTYCNLFDNCKEYTAMYRCYKTSKATK